MSVTKRDQLKLPQRKKTKIALTPSSEIYLPTFDYLTNEFQHARNHERGIIRNDDDEFIHQYRVALRKCRALISLLKPLLFEQQQEMLKNELKTLMQYTNTIRDLDVFLAKMDEYFFILDHQHHNGLTRFFDQLQVKRNAEHKQLKEWLKSDNYKQQCQLVSGLLNEMELRQTDSGRQHSEIIGYNTLWTHYKRLERQCNKINNHADDATLHELRIQCKKFRYLLEFFSPILPNRTSKHQIEQLKQLQDELGNFNDSAVQLAFFKLFLKHHDCSRHQKRAIGELIRLTEIIHCNAKKATLKKLFDFRHPDKLALYGTLNQDIKLSPSQ
ncbi:adenylate cyclase [Photobacterium aquae]|uniref:Adenylate cyclase n=1 Tax=Photobacterium aquae TaxID=1195763 RepID=A0A0J1JXE8_9GAMM|nr:CHAD domain-containing protein [Photobacterium aquae]KLV06967.1 adenylate cyclase [Photobacterium aquae]